MRRPVVAGNWKMHGSRSANQALLSELERRLEPEWPIDVVVFPPYVYLADAVRMRIQQHDRQSASGGRDDRCQVRGAAVQEQDAVC